MSTTLRSITSAPSYQGAQSLGATPTAIVPKGIVPKGIVPKGIVPKGIVPLRPVATLLAPTERPRIDQAAHGCFQPRHASSVQELAHHLRGDPVAALLLSVARLDGTQAAPLARVLRAFPRVPPVAVVLDPPGQLATTLLTMGQLGVRALVDVRSATGWRDLRRVIALADALGIEAQAIERLRGELPPDTPEETHTVLASLFQLPYGVTRVRQVADRLGVCPTTFTSRFARAKLPPPRQYLAYARLVRAAHLLENPGASITQVAHRLEYSSPQSFSRHLQFVLGINAAEFRRACTAPVMLERFMADLVRPYRERLRTFEPLATTPPWMPRLARQA